MAIEVFVPPQTYEQLKEQARKQAKTGQKDSEIFVPPETFELLKSHAGKQSGPNSENAGTDLSTQTNLSSTSGQERFLSDQSGMRIQQRHYQSGQLGRHQSLGEERLGQRQAPIGEEPLGKRFVELTGQQGFQGGQPGQYAMGKSGIARQSHSENQTEHGQRQAPLGFENLGQKSGHQPERGYQSGHQPERGYQSGQPEEYSFDNERSRQPSYNDSQLHESEKMAQTQDSNLMGSHGKGRNYSLYKGSQTGSTQATAPEGLYPGSDQSRQKPHGLDGKSYQIGKGRGF